MPSKKKKSTKSSLESSAGRFNKSRKIRARELTWLTMVGSWILFIILRPTILGFAGNDKFFGSLAVTSDGLDWITEGFALQSGVTEVWPQLRSAGFVLVTALGALLGEPAKVIGMSLSIGIALQIWAVNRILSFTSSPMITRVTLVAIFASMPFHFYSKYVLADPLAIGFLMVSIYFALRATLYFQKRDWIFAISASFVSAMFQNYGWGGILIVFALSIARRDLKARAHVLNGTMLLSGIALQLALTELWRNSIPHNAEPAQLSLLELGLGMTDFYIGIWQAIHAPIYFAALSAFAVSRLFYNKKLNQALNNRLIFDTAMLGGAFSVLVFFYQWRESRFAYIGTAFLTLALILFVQKILESAENKSKKWVMLGALTPIVFGWFWVTPLNEWNPEMNQIQHGTHWSTRWGASNVRSSDWVIEATNLYCSNDEALPTREELREIYGVSNYQSNIGKFAIENCFFKQ